MITAVTASTKALVASFEISCLIVKNEKPDTTGEALLLPAANKICENMQGQYHGQAIKAVPLSNNTMMRLTVSTFEDNKEQLSKNIAFNVLIFRHLCRSRV
jgi:hypothetical protein